MGLVAVDALVCGRWTADQMDGASVLLSHSGAAIMAARPAANFIAARSLAQRCHSGAAVSGLGGCCCRADWLAAPLRCRARRGTAALIACSPQSTLSLARVSYFSDLFFSRKLAMVGGGAMDFIAAFHPAMG